MPNDAASGSYVDHPVAHPVDHPVGDRRVSLDLRPQQFEARQWQPFRRQVVRQDVHLRRTGQFDGVGDRVADPHGGSGHSGADLNRRRRRARQSPLPAGFAVLCAPTVAVSTHNSGYTSLLTFILVSFGRTD